MTVKTLPMTGQLYQVARRITVEPGQYVIVVADVVVGVYTGDKHVPVVEAQQTQAPTEHADTPPRDTRTSNKKRNSKSIDHIAQVKEPTKRMLPVVEAITQHVAVHGVIKASELPALIGIQRGQNSWWRVRDSVRWMTIHGWLVGSGGTIGRTYHRGPNLPTPHAEQAA